MLDSTREKIRQKYTQAEIGRYMGVAQQTVWQWFSFGVPPKAGNSVMPTNEVGSYPA